MKLSLIIPVFNEQECIADCLEHVSRQIRPFDEVIIVDNNSTDATRKIVDRFADLLPLTVLEEPRQGIVYARDTGYGFASGDVLCKIDADTRIGRSWSRNVERLLTSRPEVVGAHGYGIAYDLAPGPSGKSRAIRDSLRLPPGPSATIEGNNMAVRRAGWIDAQPHMIRSLDIHEDQDLYYALRKSGQGEVWWTPKLLVGISARRMRASMFSQIAYVAATVRTFRKHRQWKSMMNLIVWFPVVMINFRINWLIAMGFDPETGTHKWSRIIHGKSHQASPI